MKKLFTLFLALIASVGTMFAESGKCGKNLTWDLSDGVLTISGTGAMTDYTYFGIGIGSNCPWYPYYSSIQKVQIGSQVTYIGSGAFPECPNLTSITIGKSVTSIGEYAFAFCPSLTSIIVDSENIQYDSRNNCNALIETATNSLILGSSTTIIPNSVTSIGSYAFSDCTGLTSIVIPNSVIELGAEAFYECTGLVSVIIGNSVTSIGEAAFYGCSGLTSVTIPSSVTSIGEDAFLGCSSLTSVICEAQTPPQIDGRIFGYDSCKLSAIYVPCGTLDAYKQSWSSYKNIIRYHPLEYNITGNVENPDQGCIVIPSTICEPLTASSYYGYHFTQWSDGITDNPRTIVLTQDTTFTAEFAKNAYTITTVSSNTSWGVTTGDTTALYLDEVEIAAAPNYGYHFVRWNYYQITSNPLTITITKDQEFLATFAKNTYTISKQFNSVQGYISGASQAEYLDEVKLTAVPNTGCHFIQWSDGIKDNPRSLVLTQDTTFTAEFAFDRTGTCGNDYALTWTYDPEKHILTISGEGAFNEHMECGIEAKQAMTHLIIDKGVTSIGENAFNGCSYLSHLTIGESVKTINNNAFYNCVNLETIINYRPTPTNAYSTSFDGVDKFECTLYVLESSLDMYKNASVWRDFYYTKAIGAEENSDPIDDVKVDPTDNTAQITWPKVTGADTYTITITKDGQVVCTLVFNANGQLIGIAFAPSANRQQEQTTGFSFTVTGLNSNTQYSYTVVAKNSSDEPIDTKSGSFTTTGTATDIDQITDDQSPITNKVIKDGQIFILRGDKTYTVTGQEVK